MADSYSFAFPEAILHQRVLWAALRLERGADKAFSTIGLSTAKFYILVTLGRHPDRQLSPTNIGARLLMERSNLTSILDRMERDGLVQRQPHPTDRRSLLISLTDHGQAQLDRAAELYEAVVRQLVQGVTPAEVTVLNDILGRIEVAPPEVIAVREKSQEADRALARAG